MFYFILNYAKKAKELQRNDKNIKHLHFFLYDYFSFKEE
jgi:hypothetical protein